MEYDEYEAYKQKKITHHIKNDFEQVRCSAESFAKDFYDTNDHLQKAFICKLIFLFVIIFAVDSTPEPLSYVFWAVAIGLLFFIWDRTNKFKKDLGKELYLRYGYRNTVRAHIDQDRSQEIRHLGEETRSLVNAMNYHLNDLRSNKYDIPQEMQFTLDVIYSYSDQLSDISKKISSLEKYDEFAKEMETDFHFLKEMQ